MFLPDLTDVGWTKSSYSGGNNGACVEMAFAGAVTAVRDSKLGDASPVLAFPGAVYAGFVAAAKGGKFDLA